MKRTKTQQNADKFLRNYRNFQNLAQAGDSPFSIRAGELVSEIDSIIKELDPTSRAIVLNLYCFKSTKEKKSRTAMCRDLALSLIQYQTILNQALDDFAKSYKQGVLEDA